MMERWLPALLFGVGALAMACAEAPIVPPAGLPDDQLPPPAANQFDLPVCANPYYASYSLPEDSIRVRYGDGPWQTVNRTGNVYRLTKAPKLVVAFGRFSGRYIVAASGDELAAIDCTVIPRWSSFLNGLVTNIEPALTWRVMPATTHGRNGDRTLTDFQIPFPDSGADLIMSTRDSNARRVIVRRGVKGTQGEMMPTFDMAGPEAHDLTVASVAVQGASLDSLFPLVCFRSGSLRHRLYGGAGIYGGVTSSFDRSYAVPASLLRAGDTHEYLLLERTTSIGGDCDVPRLVPLAYYYRDAKPVTVVLGPALSVPTNSVDQSKACFPARAELPSQAEYASFVRLRVFSRSEVVEVWITRAYLGALPSAWSVDVPGPLVEDVCPSAWHERFYGVIATAAAGRLSTALGGKPTDGELVRTATRRVELPWP